MPHGRQQQSATYNRQTNVTNSRQMISSAGGHMMNTRPNLSASAQTGQQLLVPPQFIVNYPYDPRHFTSEQMFYTSYPTGVLVSQQRPSNAHHIQAAQMANPMANIAGTGGASIHQGGAHQQLTTISSLTAQSSPHQMQPIYGHPMQPKHEVTKRQRNPLRIVDPNTGEEVVINDTSSSSSNQHSSALKLEPPPPSQQIQKTQTAQSTVNNQTNESCDANVTNIQYSNIEHSIEHGQIGSVDQQNYQTDANELNIEEPPHTPVVSANADGPSVDITPKQSKNVKRKYVLSKIEQKTKKKKHKNHSNNL